MSDVVQPLPAIEIERKVTDRLWLFVSDQEHPSVGCDGNCYQGAGVVGNVPYPRRNIPVLRRATEADLERLGFVRKT